MSELAEYVWRHWTDTEAQHVFKIQKDLSIW